MAMSKKQKAAKPAVAARFPGAMGLAPGKKKAVKAAVKKAVAKKRAAK